MPPITEDEFNELANGPLYHPNPEITAGRLLFALWKVLEVSGAEGEAAFRLFCEDVTKANAKIEMAIARLNYDLRHGQAGPPRGGRK